MRSFERVPSPLRHRFAILAIGSGLVLFFGLVVLTPFHFFPLFPLFWVIPFLAVRGMGMALARARLLPSSGRPGEERGERELLEALERRGPFTATRAALETSLSVAEAEDRLSRLTENGHLQVNAHGGSLAYSLWDTDQHQSQRASARRSEIEDDVA